MGTEGKNQQKKETKLKKARVRPPCKTKSRGNTATRNMLQCTTTREKTAAGTDGGRK